MAISISGEKPRKQQDKQEKEKGGGEDRQVRLDTSTEAYGVVKQEKTWVLFWAVLFVVGFG